MKSFTHYVEHFVKILIVLSIAWLAVIFYFDVIINRGIEVEVDFENRQYIHRQYDTVFDWIEGDVTEYTEPFEPVKTEQMSSQPQPIVDQP